MSLADGSASFDIWLPRPMLPFLQPKRHKVAHGGRGGGKSWGFGNLILARCIERKTRALCVREVQKSIKQSVHRLLSDLIQSSGWSRLFDVQATVIKCANGSEIEFTGMQDHTSDSIKSFESVDLCWVEEAQSISATSAEVLVPTIRKPGAEIWWSFNPTLESDYVYQRFIKRGDPEAIVAPVSWRDNPKLSTAMEAERTLLRSINEDLYQHVWEGQLRSLAGMLFKRRWFKTYDRLPDSLRMYMAGDYAGARDPDADREPDSTDFGCAGLDTSGGLYFTSWWNGQVDDPDEWITAGAMMAKREKPLIWFEEKGPVLRSLDASITKRMRELDVHVLRYPLASVNSKAERALGFAARASAGAVYFPNEPWAERVINQLCAFTGDDGKVDDAVDVCSLLARGLDQMANAQPKAKPEEKPFKPFTRAHFEAADRMREREEQERDRHYR